MRKYLTLIVFCILGCIITLLFQISQGVQSEEDTLKEIRSEIAAEQEKIRVYKSEWTYLVRPERLEKLAGKYTSLVPQSAGIRVPVNEIPFPSEITASADNTDSTVKTDASADKNNENYYIEACDTNTSVISSGLKRNASYTGTKPSAMRISVSFKDVWGGTGQ